MRCPRAVAAVLVAAQASCASITASRTERLQVSGTPPGATVLVDGQARATVPGSVELPRSGSSRVEVSAPGHRLQQCSTATDVGGGYLAADIVLCVLLFPLGCISFIDAGGAWNQLRWPTCNVDLAREQAAPGAAAAAAGRPLSTASR